MKYPLENMRKKCRADKNAAFSLAYHNIGAGGVTAFCGTIGDWSEPAAPSNKRRYQRAIRAARRLGVDIRK